MNYEQMAEHKRLLIVLEGQQQTIDLLLLKITARNNEIESLRASLTHCQTVNTEMVQTIRDLQSSKGTHGEQEH